MEIIIKGPKPTDPRQRVLAIEAAAQAICEPVGQDPADGTMMLLTAAVHVAMRHSGKTGGQLLETLAYSLGCATVAADDFFALKVVARPADIPIRTGEDKVDELRRSQEEDRRLRGDVSGLRSQHPRAGEEG